METVDVKEQGGGAPEFHQRQLKSNMTFTGFSNVMCNYLCWKISLLYTT